MVKKLSSLSKSGQSLASNPARIDFELFMDAAQNLYHPKTNPEGAFALNIAENSVSTAWIQNKLDEITAKNKMPDWVMKYTDPKGNPEVRQSVATFMENHLCKCPIAADSLVLSAGATSVIEISSFGLADPGDVVVIPAPSYPMYTNDMGVKSKLVRYDLQTHFYLDEIGSSAPVTVAMLKKAKKQIKAQRKRFKILLITSPDNPTGCVYSKDQLKKLATWCIENKIHMIVNEIYGLSLIDTSIKAIKKDYPISIEFQSFAGVMRKKKSPYLHLWYAFSKDFAMSGLRFGVVHSHNESFIQALSNINIPHMVSNYTQWMVGEMLNDDDFISSYIQKNKKRLNKSYLLVIKFLKKLDIPYIPSRGSLFVWADFSKYMSKYSAKAEEKMWLDIYRKSGVLLTPGMGFQHRRMGMFRIVFTAVPYEYLEVALDRMSIYLKSL
ncbi:MAG: aminotransferase class I/II-fold pyridoxal phosphate-dependent enzyme [Bacteroidota bacterium]